MTIRFSAVLPAMVLALGAATALPQLAAHPFAQFAQASVADHTGVFRPYDPVSAMAADAAFVGDGSTPGYLQEQQALTREPGYSVGTG